MNMRCAARSQVIGAAVWRPGRTACAGVVGAMRHDVPVTLARASWLATVIVCVITAALLFVADYLGYGFVALAIGASAAINLR